MPSATSSPFSGPNLSGGPLAPRAGCCCRAGGALAGVVAIPSPGAFSARAPHRFRGDGLGIAPGKIKHVWLIILENKSYEATFTGLNKNTYLWRTLPTQGVLLKNYYGTGAAVSITT
jgi:hypothetical protein